MKKIAFFLLLAAGSLVSMAQQKPNEDSVINLIQEDICTEISKSKPTDFTAENFQMKLGMIFINVFQKHNDAMVQLYGEDYLTNQEKMMGMSQKMGMQLAMSCKTFQEIVMNNPELVNAAMEQSPMAMPKKKKNEAVQPNAGSKSVAGKVVSYTPGEFSYYTVKAGTQTKKVYWMGNFDGDDELIANPKKIAGKNATFEIAEMKIYNSVSKTYKKILVITSYSSGM